jgi:hypothetical protein
MMADAGMPLHNSKNKLRDVDDQYVEHMFSLNREILLSYDVCGACEAHALLLSLSLSLSPDLRHARYQGKDEDKDKDVASALTLQELYALAPGSIANNVNFAHCPKF